jgi:para-nitrobenzyl esterase
LPSWCQSTAASKDELFALFSEHEEEARALSNPNGDGHPQWPRHDPESDLIMNFTNDGAIMEPDPLHDRLDLWEKAWHDVSRDP